MNTCHYNDGSKHECCNHQHYCIFNEKRWELETKIMDTWREHDKLKRLHNSYLKGYYCGDVDYNFLLKKLDLVRHNLSRLVEYKNKIIKGEINGYGFLES